VKIGKKFKQVVSKAGLSAVLAQAGIKIERLMKEDRR
jgi:hypothetical protein